MPSSIVRRSRADARAEHSVGEDRTAVGLGSKPRRRRWCDDEELGEHAARRARSERCASSSTAARAPTGPAAREANAEVVAAAALGRRLERQPPPNPAPAESGRPAPAGSSPFAPRRRAHRHRRRVRRAGRRASQNAAAHPDLRIRGRGWHWRRTSRSGTQSQVPTGPGFYDGATFNERRRLSHADHRISNPPTCAASARCRSSPVRGRRGPCRPPRDRRLTEKDAVRMLRCA